MQQQKFKFISRANLICILKEISIYMFICPGQISKLNLPRANSTNLLE